MAVTLAANINPQGTRPGSPIKVVDTFSTNGGTEYTLALPISDKAQAGDVVWVFIALTQQNWPGVFTGFATNPTGFFTGAASNFAFVGGGTGVQMQPFYRVVQAGDAGKVVGLSWNATLNQLGWGLIAYTLRYVNTSVIFDVAGTYATSGTSPSLNSSTGAITPTSNGTLVLGAIADAAGVTGVGVTPGPLPGWYNTTDAVGGRQPNTGLVSGITDITLAGASYLGAGCQWASGGGSVSSNWVGTLIAFRHTPQPSAPGFYLNPAAGSMDAADVAGRPLTAHWTYTPVNGQGKQIAWLFVRQTTGGSITQFWNGDINGWVNGEYWNYAPADQRSYTFPSGAWLNDGTQWNAYMAITEDALSYKSDLAGPITFTTLAPPAVTGVTVTNPGTTTPTINWTEALTNTPQVAYRVRVFSSDQLALPGFDPSNMLVDDDSDFELSIGTWSGVGTALQLGASHNFTGSGDLFIQALSTTGVFAYSGSYPVTPGVTYRASAYVWADVTPRAMTLAIFWQDANGNQIATTNGTPVTDSTTVWNQVTVAGVAPTGAVTARVLIKNSVSAVNEVHRLDQVHFAATPAPKWSSGVVLSTALSTTTAALAPSVQYTAYVEVLQTNDQWTPVAAVSNGSYINNPTATWFAGLTAAPVPAPAALTAVVGG